MAFRFWIVLFLAVFSYCTTRGQCPPAPCLAHPDAENKGLLRGEIVDPADAPIPAFVFVHSDLRTSKIAAQIPISSDGTFQINLAPGLYDLFVGYTAFQPIARVVEIKSGKTTHLKLAMKLDEKHLQPVLVE